MEPHNHVLIPIQELKVKKGIIKRDGNLLMNFHTSGLCFAEE